MHSRGMLWGIRLEIENTEISLKEDFILKLFLAISVHLKQINSILKIQSSAILFEKI